MMTNVGCVCENDTELNLTGFLQVSSNLIERFLMPLFYCHTQPIHKYLILI